MGFQEIPGGQEVLVHEDGRVRLGLRNLPKDSQRLQWPKDKEGNRKNEWPSLVIRTGLNEPERKMLLPEAVMKAHEKIPPSVQVYPEDFIPRNGSRTSISDSGLENVEYKPTGKHVEGAGSGGQYIDKPENRKKEKSEDSSEQETQSKSEPKEEPKPNADAKQMSEGMEKLQKGSGELTAKEAIEIIENYDFEELRDLNFYTEDERERGPRTTVKEAWDNKLAEYEEEHS